MQKFVGLLRAVNVGGTGKLPMAELHDMCVETGFHNPKTLLASGNVVFETQSSQRNAFEALNQRLCQHFGAEIGLFVLNATEMTAVRDGNPFADHSPSQVGVLFVEPVPTEQECAAAKGLKDEVIVQGNGVLYVKFPSGMGQSKLVVPSAKTGTMRNMNTVEKLTVLLNE